MKTKLILVTTTVIACFFCALVLFQPAEAKSKTIYVEKGKKYQLSLKNIKKYKLTSSKQKVAKVNRKGTIKAIKKGNCVIYAVRRKRRVVYRVHVVNKITLTGEKTYGDINETIQLNFSVGNKKGKWKSSDTSVAVVSPTGRVTTKGYGTCVILVRYLKKTYRYYLEVKAAPGGIMAKAMYGNVENIQREGTTIYYQIRLLDGAAAGISIRVEQPEKLYEYTETDGVRRELGKEDIIQSGERVKLIIIVNTRKEKWGLQSGMEVKPEEILVCR